MRTRDIIELQELEQSQSSYLPQIGNYLADDAYSAWIMATHPPGWLGPWKNITDIYVSRELYPILKNIKEIRAKYTSKKDDWKTWKFSRSSDGLTVSVRFIMRDGLACNHIMIDGNCSNMRGHILNPILK